MLVEVAKNTRTVTGKASIISKELFVPLFSRLIGGYFVSEGVRFFLNQSMASYIKQRTIIIPQYARKRIFGSI